MSTAQHILPSAGIAGGRIGPGPPDVDHVATPQLPLRPPTTSIDAHATTNSTVSTDSKSDGSPNTHRFTQIRNEFTDAMTNAIIRLLEKNPELTKSSAERNVFCALGYECTAHDSEPAEQGVVDHFRVQHIMRSVDAVRSVRLKGLYALQLQHRPNASPQEILSALTVKLNALFLPSPSPPPIPKPESRPKVVTAPVLSDSERSTISTSPAASSSSSLLRGRNVNYSINHRDPINKKRKAQSPGCRERNMHSNHAQPAIFVTMSEPTPATSRQGNAIAKSRTRSTSASREQTTRASGSQPVSLGSVTVMDPLLAEQSRLLSQYARPTMGLARPEYLLFDDEVDQKFKRHCAKMGAKASAKAARKRKRMKEEAQQPPTKRPRMGKKQGKRQKGRRKRLNPKMRSSLSPSVERQREQMGMALRRSDNNYSTDPLDESEEDLDLTHSHVSAATNSHARHII